MNNWEGILAGETLPKWVPRRSWDDTNGRVEQAESARELGFPWWPSGWDFIIFTAGAPGSISGQGTKILYCVNIKGRKEIQVLSTRVCVKSYEGIVFEGSLYKWQVAYKARNTKLGQDHSFPSMPASASTFFCWPQWTCEKGRGTVDPVRDRSSPLSQCLRAGKIFSS